MVSPGQWQKHHPGSYPQIISHNPSKIAGLISEIYMMAPIATTKPHNPSSRLRPCTFDWTVRRAWRNLVRLMNSFGYMPRCR